MDPTAWQGENRCVLLAAYQGGQLYPYVTYQKPHTSSHEYPFKTWRSRAWVRKLPRRHQRRSCRRRKSPWPGTSLTMAFTMLMCMAAVALILHLTLYIATGIHTGRRLSKAQMEVHHSGAKMYTQAPDSILHGHTSPSTSGWISATFKSMLRISSTCTRFVVARADRDPSPEAMEHATTLSLQHSWENHPGKLTSWGLATRTAVLSDDMYQHTRQSWDYRPPQHMGGVTSLTSSVAANIQQPLTPCEHDTVTVLDSRCTRPGPKSGLRLPHAARPSWVMRLCTLWASCGWAKGVRVSTLPGGVEGVAMTTTMAPSLATKHTGRQRVSVPIQQAMSRQGKRSYQRACRRAQAQGGTMYRGRWVTSQELNAREQQSGNRPPQTRRSTAGQQHWQILTWNAGGLHEGLYTEVLTYMHDHTIDIGMIQETKWKFTSTWSSQHYHFIHSGGTSEQAKHGGVLTMISRRLTQANQIQYNSILDGRLLHVRFLYQNSGIDLINTYQYAINNSAGLFDRRHHLWVRLSQCMQRIPVRNHLIAAGDYNTTCSALRGHCGHQTLPFDSSKVLDQAEFMQILQTNDLVALNTWKKGQAATYSWGETKSQIDYVLIRRSHATPLSQMARPIWWRVAQWRQGAQHHPVQAQVPVKWTPWRRGGLNPARPTLDRAEMIRAMKDSDERFYIYRRQVQALIATRPSLDNLHDEIQKVASSVFPSTSTTTTSSSVDDPTIIVGVRDMWHTFRLMRQNNRDGKGIFKAWRQWTAFMKQHKTHKQRSRRHRKQKLLDMLIQAQAAADKHDMHSVYKIVRQLAPKTPHRVLQLRKEGFMLTPQEELNWMLQFFGERFGESQDCMPPSRFLSQPFLLDAEQLQCQLAKIPVHKAVPKNDPAGVTWKAVADIIAPYVCEYVREEWYPHALRIPTMWTSASMIFLQKPGKTGCEPRHWRPIALQDALGKSVISVVTEQAKPWIHMWLQQFPQCAYLPHRSTSTALRRVFQHCDKVRGMCAEQTYNLHSKKAGTRYKPFVGGLQVCLDLSAAFDLLPRRHLATALDLAGVPEDVQQVLLAWLDQAVYHVEHKALTGTVRPTRGVRQGCRASPILWAAFTGLICFTLEQQLGAQWANRHLTIYADDHHAQWELHQAADLDRAIQELNVLRNILMQLGMEANPGKAEAILMCKGNLAQSSGPVSITKKNGCF